MESIAHGSGGAREEVEVCGYGVAVLLAPAMAERAAAATLPGAGPLKEPLAKPLLDLPPLEPLPLPPFSPLCGLGKKSAKVGCGCSLPLPLEGR